VYSLSANAMIQNLGLSWTFRILCILQFVVNIISAILLKDRNEAIGSTLLAFDVRLLQRAEFLLTLAWSFFSVFGFIVLLFSMPNYAASIGLTSTQGSLVGALLSLSQGLTRPPFGYLCDAAGPITTATAATAMAGVLCFVFWVFARDFGSVIAFAIIQETICGTFFNTVAPVGAEVVGLVELPSTLSIAWISIIV
jgi:hypothetical protein